jgi:hypothetical protein
MWRETSTAADGELPDSAYERALMLRTGLVTRATGGAMADQIYRLLRQGFIDEPHTKQLLPQFVRTCRTVDDFWSYIAATSPTYQGRRDHLREQFEPLMDYLERASAPASAMISEALLSYDETGIHHAWAKALERSESDPDGAITAARTLLESVCKHILDERSVGPAYSDADDLPKLYRKASEKLNLAPSQHAEEIFKRVLGGCTSVVEGLGSLRNKVGDAHGQGKRRQVRAASRHAHLAVNLAGAMSLFLIETLLA